MNQIEKAPRDICELSPAMDDNPNAVHVDIGDVRVILERHFAPASDVREALEGCANALERLLKAYEKAFDWTADLPPETAEAERVANDALFKARAALKSTEPEPSGVNRAKPL